MPLQKAVPGHLTGGDIDFPVAGAWTIVITSRYGEFDSNTFEVTITLH